MKRYSSFLSAACALLIVVLLAPVAFAHFDQSSPEWKKEQSRGQKEDAAAQAAPKQAKVAKEVKVNVELDKPRGIMAPGSCPCIAWF